MEIPKHFTTSAYTLSYLNVMTIYYQLNNLNIFLKHYLIYLK